MHAMPANHRWQISPSPPHCATHTAVYSDLTVEQNFLVEVDAVVSADTLSPLIKTYHAPYSVFTLATCAATNLRAAATSGEWN